MTDGQLSPVPTHQRIKMRPAALSVRQGVAILNRRKTKKYSLFSVHTTTSSSAASTDTAVDKGAGCPENIGPPRECRSASAISDALLGNTTSRRAADGGRIDSFFFKAIAVLDTYVRRAVCPRKSGNTSAQANPRRRDRFIGPPRLRGLANIITPVSLKRNIFPIGRQVMPIQPTLFCGAQTCEFFF